METQKQRKQWLKQAQLSSIPEKCIAQQMKNSCCRNNKKKQNEKTTKDKLNYKLIAQRSFQTLLRSFQNTNV